MKNPGNRPSERGITPKNGKRSDLQTQNQAVKFPIKPHEKSAELMPVILGYF
jgi:hypothetical protein